MAPDTATFADRLLACPVGCAFLLTVERDRPALERAVEPGQAFARAAIALRALNPWSPRAAGARQAALAAARRLETLADAIVRHPGAAWWWAPFDARSQIAIVSATRHSSRRGELPDGAARRWESYAQRPAAWRLTSTAHDRLTCADVVIAAGVGDWPQGLPYERSAVSLPPAPRVFEVGCADDWHGLCTEFPAPDASPSSPAGAGALSPDWQSLRTKWDAVHLSFGGLLSAPFVRRASVRGTTMLWSWDSEGTIWVDDARIGEGEPLSAPALPQALSLVPPLELD